MYRKLVAPIVTKRPEIVRDSLLSHFSEGIEGFLSIRTVDLLLNSYQMHLRSVAELEFGSGTSSRQAERELFRIIEKSERNRERMSNPRLLYHASQAWNLEFFMCGLTRKSNESSSAIPVNVLKMIERDFGTWNAFQRTFHAHASAMIGCGWVWLVSSASENKLSIQTTFNGASPLFKSSSNDPETPSNCSVSSVINSPILGLNLWESAFTLDYSLDRDLYVTNWWNAINWNRAAVLLSR